MSFFRTLIRPDREETPERAEAGRAANILQVGEFQLLQLAYFEWHGQDMPESITHNLFHAYMMHNEVPHWVRHYARRIISLDEQQIIDDTNPDYHRYDSTYTTFTPNGVRKFILASGVIIGLLGGGIILGHMSTHDGVSVLPPYFDKNELKQNKSSVLPWQRD